MPTDRLWFAPPCSECWECHWDDPKGGITGCVPEKSNHFWIFKSSKLKSLNISSRLHPKPQAEDVFWTHPGNFCSPLGFPWNVMSFAGRPGTGPRCSFTSQGAVVLPDRTRTETAALKARNVGGSQERNRAAVIGALAKIDRTPMESKKNQHSTMMYTMSSREVVNWISFWYVFARSKVRMWRIPVDDV